MDLSPLLSSLPFPSWSPMQVSLQGSLEEGTSAKGNPICLGWMGRCGFGVRCGNPSCFPAQGEGGGVPVRLSPPGPFSFQQLWLPGPPEELPGEERGALGAS